MMTQMTCMIMIRRTAVTRRNRNSSNSNENPMNLKRCMMMGYKSSIRVDTNIWRNTSSTNRSIITPKQKTSFIMSHLSRNSKLKQTITKPYREIFNN